MLIDTDSDPVCVENPSLVPVDADSAAPAEFIPAKVDIAPRDNFKVLLAYLDAKFAPLLAAEKVKQMPQSQKTDAVSPGVELISPMELSPQDLQAFTAFQAAGMQPPALINFEPPNVTPSGKSLPRQGLGPPVIIGFDAEWDWHAAGRNKLLSVQFHLVGPSGKSLQKVVSVRDGERYESRPSLSNSLDELLDDAEIACIFDEWPCEVILCGFFTRADIPVFRDAKQFIHQLQSINGTLASVGKPATVSLPLSEERSVRLKSRYRLIVGGGFDPHVLSVRLIDSRALAPPGVSLYKIGEWMGLPKLKLPTGFKKSEMGRFARKRPQGFRAYGLRDAEIAAMYFMWVLWFCDRHLGLKGVSATASGLGVRLALLCMRRDGVHPDVALNFVKVNRCYWSERHGKPRSHIARQPEPVRQWFESFLADAYLGGRNECYWFGPTPIASDNKLLYDHDLAGCYVVSLAGLMVMDYDRIEVVRDKERFRGEVAGFAQVRFRFPPETVFPCLPVMVGSYGLWFPLSGVSIATAPEIELAMLMGAEIEVLFGVIIPWMARDEVFARSQRVLRQKKEKKRDANLEWDGDVLVPEVEMKFPPESHGDLGYRPFESFAIYTRTERLRYRKKTLPNEFMKLLGNSAYGKTGQGFKGKRAFGPQTMKSELVGRSSISEVGVAAMTSGFARATLAEILWKLPAGTQVVSATTDGLLVDVEQLDLSGPMCRRFMALVERVAPGTPMTEVKHRVAQIVAAKTRLQLTGRMVEGEEPVVAKGGIKVLLDAAEGDEDKERELLKPQNQNKYVLDLFVNRYPGQKIIRPSMMSARDQLLKDFDLQVTEIETQLGMEFDFKRRPVDPIMVKIDSHGVEHLAFSTVPWDNVEEGELVRVLFDQWRRGDGKDKPGHCLKNLEDWNQWQSFQGLYAGNRKRRRQYQIQLEESGDAKCSATKGDALELDSINPPSTSVANVERVRKPPSRGLTGVLYATKEGHYLGIVIRIFMAAYVQRAWGLSNVDLSQSKLAKWLTEMGFPTKLHDVKNSGRMQLSENVMPRTPEVLSFLEAMKQRFPELEVDRFLVPN